MSERSCRNFKQLFRMYSSRRRGSQTGNICWRWIKKEWTARIQILTNIKGESILNISEIWKLQKGRVWLEVKINRKWDINTESIKQEKINIELSNENARVIVSILNDYKDLIVRNVKQIDCTNRASRWWNQILLFIDLIIYRIWEQ